MESVVHHHVHSSCGIFVSAVCNIGIPKVSEYFGAYKNSMFTAGACYNLHCDVPGALSIRRKSGVNAIGMWSLSVLDQLVGGRITSHSTPLTQKNVRNEKVAVAELIQSVRSYCGCEDQECERWCQCLLVCWYFLSRRMYCVALPVYCL